ncbi:MAG TPA: hypothetical protein VGC90_11165 [Candidatus Limnocylindrales bacterium]
MSTDEQHVALPKLYGGPAYARPVVAPAEVKPRPFDPDEMPITAYQTDDERDLLESLPPRAFGPGGIVLAGDGDRSARRPRASLVPRPFRLRSLAVRIFGGSS